VRRLGAFSVALILHLAVLLGLRGVRILTPVPDEVSFEVAPPPPAPEPVPPPPPELSPATRVAQVGGSAPAPRRRSTLSRERPVALVAWRSPEPPRVDPVVLGGFGAAAALVGRAPPQGSPEGSGSGPGSTPGPGSGPGCDPLRASSIYIVDDRNRLVVFDPARRSFGPVGRLRCPADENDHPYSMSIDRGGRAWILYSSGELFQASTRDASCTRTGWRPGRGGFELFGMGFASLAPGSTSETLYIAGGRADEMAHGRGRVAAIDPRTLAVRDLGAHERGDYSPELSGTGDARLFAFYPGEEVALIDRDNGAPLARWPLPGLGLSGRAEAWAFAAFGGRFYLFVAEASGVFSVERHNRVYTLDPRTRRATRLLGDTPYRVVGAGVSTCAPSVR